MKSIRLINYRSLEDSGDIIIRPLTFLLGANSTYVLTIRDYSQPNGKYTHEPVYVGQAGNFRTRDFANYHKREEIEATGSHSIGICLADQMSDLYRKNMEKDLLEVYYLPCYEFQEC